MALPHDIYERIFHLIGDPIFIKDRLHRLVMLNDACCQALGKSREELLGLSDYDLFSDEEAAIFRIRDERVFLTGMEDINEESFTRPDSDPKTVVTRKQLYLDPESNPFIVGIFKDISALKNAEAKLQRTNETLEEKVRERTVELERANGEMKIRIGQLNYLNEKGRAFARLLHREEVLEEIFRTFSERFPGCPVHLVERIGDRLKSIRHSTSLESGLASCLEILERDGVDRELEIDFRPGDPGISPIRPGFPGHLWIPLFSGIGFLGGVQVLLPKDSEAKLAADMPLLGTLSTQASVALDNANHYLALREKTRIESELQVARKIQMHYVPETPSIPNFSLNGVCLPAQEIGGDYLDYFRNENGDWIIVIADVCGKGIPAALVMTSLRSCIRSEGRREKSSKELLISVNRLMGAELQRERSFITCLCIILSENGVVLNFSRAGHPALVVSGRSLKAPESYRSKGIALGMVAGEEFRSRLEEINLPLHPGDRFFAYTDGVDEAKDAMDRPYGKVRLFDLLERNRDCAPTQLIEEVLADVRLHVKDHRQYDDMTLLCLDKIH